MARMTVAGHSFHAIINDWPIGLFSTSFIFDCVGFVTKKKAIAQSGYYTQLAGYISGIMAAASGIAEYRAIERKGDVKRLADRHAILNGSMMVLATASLLLRRKNKEEVTALPLALSAAANVLTIVSAWTGDEMVYGHRVRVQDQQIKPGDRDLRPPGDQALTDVLRAGTSPSHYVW